MCSAINLEYIHRNAGWNYSKGAILFLLFQLTLSLLSIGAQVQHAIESFNKKNYAEYLTCLEKEFSVTPLSKLSYETIARSAVAIEKTKGWESKSGKQARELLKESADVLRYLDAMVRFRLEREYSIKAVGRIQAYLRDYYDAICSQKYIQCLRERK